jgi:ABC-type transporter Mla MlaB component
VSETLRIEGDLTYATANGEWLRLTPELTNIVDIDASGVSRIDSAGLALLTALRRHDSQADTTKGKSGGSARARRLIHATPDIRRLATAYDVAELFV